MRISLVSGPALALACLLSFPGAAAAQETESVNRTVPFPANGTLRVDNFSGHITIAGTSGRDVVIKAVRRGERERLDRVKLDIHTDGSTVVIQADQVDDSRRNQNNNVVETDLDIQVPASAVLRVSSFSSDIDIKDVAGDQRLHSFSGKVTVGGAKGALDVDTFSGDVEVDMRNAGTTPDLRGHTFSGDMRIRLADSARGEITYSGHNGSFDSDMPVVMHSSRRGRVSADLPGGSGGHGIALDTFSGSVRILK